jgi:ABC-type multidrug transport system permease subunit
MSKVCANGLVIAVAVGPSLSIVVRTIFGILIAGSILLLMVGVVIYLFFATAMAFFSAQGRGRCRGLGLLYMLVYLPMNMLSGANTELESMPPWLAAIMEASPSTHFVSFAQSILYRGAGIDVALAGIPRGRACHRAVLPAGDLALPVGRRADDLMLGQRLLSFSSMTSSARLSSRRPT